MISSVGLAENPINDALVRRLFRHGDDTATIAKLMRTDEAQIVRMLHRGREADRQELAHLVGGRS